jgi:hypothetical protein
MPLAVMTALSFVAMYILMYSMVDRIGYVYNSVNQVWMAGLMAASMVLIEIVIMRGMYPHVTANHTTVRSLDDSAPFGSHFDVPRSVHFGCRAEETLRRDHREPAA